VNGDGGVATLAEGLRVGERVLHPYRGVAERAAALQVLRTALASGPVPYTIHPGEWDWWCFHPDPRVPAPVRLIGPDALLDASAAGEVSAFGLGPDELGAICAAAGSVGWVSTNDHRRERVLDASGFAPTGPAMTVFERPTSGGVPGADRLPAGFVVRSLQGPAEASTRADAARDAFSSTMSPAMHRARYRRFMASPAYDRRRDVVAVGPDGVIGSFAIFWPDAALSLGQLEPVGTRHDHQRRGLAAAVIAECLARMAAAGITTARVCTDDPRTAAIGLYRRCGFAAVDRLRWWVRDPSRRSSTAGGVRARS